MKEDIYKADGINLYNKNNEKYIDTRFGNGTFILGHNDRETNDKISEQINRGTLFGFTNENEKLFVSKLKEILPQYEDFNFCTTGSESVMKSFRIARSYTGKNKIALIEGFWHGSYDGTQIKNSEGIDNILVKNTIILPSNEQECFVILEREKNNLAMIFMEPIQQTLPIIKKDFVKGIRKFCTDNNILLGFDEIITGFRMSLLGGQGLLNIYPDLSCYAKTIGMGYPLSIIGFNKKIKDHLENTNIKFGGTFSGNPLSTFAGKLFLEKILNLKDLYEKINNLTKDLCIYINDYCMNYDIPLKIYYSGSMYRIIFSNKKIYSFSDKVEKELGIKLQKELYHIFKIKGLAIGNNPLSFISYKHSKKDIEILKDIYIKSIKEWNEKFIIRKESGYYFVKSDDKIKFTGKKESFENLYNDIYDPWDQSKKFLDEFIKTNYSFILKKYIKDGDKIIDIGCGNGYSTMFIHNINKKVKLYGADISMKAVSKAKKMFKQIEFFQHDINDPLKNKSNVIVLSSMIWYILENINICIQNIINCLDKNGFFIIHNMFLKNQLYGKEIFYGYSGLINFLNKKFKDKLKIIDSVSEKEKDKYWGCIILQKI